MTFKSISICLVFHKFFFKNMVLVYSQLHWYKIYEQFKLNIVLNSTTHTLHKINKVYSFCYNTIFAKVWRLLFIDIHMYSWFWLKLDYIWEKQLSFIKQVVILRIRSWNQVPSKQKWTLFKRPNLWKRPLLFQKSVVFFELMKFS